MISYRKGNVNITHTSRSLSKDWYPSFHNASNIITKAAGLNFLIFIKTSLYPIYFSKLRKGEFTMIKH